MKHSHELRRCLVDCDAEGIMKLWKHVAPHLPQPETAYEANAAIHMARTQSERMPVKLRLYSHAWLRDEGLPSQLPDHLKSRADRLYPVGTRAVGIATHTRTPRANGIRGVMEYAVNETYADGHSDEPQVVKARMMEKRADFIRKADGIAARHIFELDTTRRARR